MFVHHVIHVQVIPAEDNTSSGKTKQMVVGCYVDARKRSPGPVNEQPAFMNTEPSP